VELSESYTFAAPPGSVWLLLTDPDVVASCLPGCEGLEPLGNDRYRAKLTLSVASISGQYTGTVSMLDMRPPAGYRLLVEGQGKGGFVNGQATLALTEEAGSTRVSVVGQAEVGGLIAAVGQRLLRTVSKMMMDKFFGCLQAKAQAQSPGGT
jgi:carbon monoxide dehydrogenase subunit G